MLSARSTNQRFDVGRQLRWTGTRPARPIGQDGHAACRRRPAWWRHPLDPPRRPRPHGGQPDATKSMAGMPCGRSLYGSIPEQLADDTSCTRQLQSCGCARITASQPVSRSTSLTRSGGRPPQRLPAPISAAVAASRRVAEGVRDAAVESGEAAWVNRCRSSPRCSYISLKNTFTSSSRGRRH
jgi:hypothetical protein